MVLESLSRDENTSLSGTKRIRSGDQCCPGLKVQTSTPMKMSVLAVAVCISILASSAVRASGDSLVTAVSSKVSNGYSRKKLPDGSFQREYYALTKGVYTPGIASDRSIDGVKFPQVAKIVAQFLSLKNFYLAPDSKSADLLLQISWGKTVPFNDVVGKTNMDAFFSTQNSLNTANAAVEPGNGRGTDGIQSAAASVRDAARDESEGQLLQMTMFQSERRSADEHNARLLGYTDDINNGDTPAQFAGAGTAYHDLISDIENERYYVIITAYDFHSFGKTEEPRIAWTTRVSIQAQGNRFNESLAAMLNRAMQYVGQDSGRLVRQYEREGKVKLGDLITVGADTSHDENPQR